MVFIIFVNFVGFKTRCPRQNLSNSCGQRRRGRGRGKGWRGLWSLQSLPIVPDSRFFSDASSSIAFRSMGFLQFGNLLKQHLLLHFVRETVGDAGPAPKIRSRDDATFFPGATQEAIATLNLLSSFHGKSVESHFPT